MVINPEIPSLPSKLLLQVDHLSKDLCAMHGHEAFSRKQMLVFETRYSSERLVRKQFNDVNVAMLHSKKLSAFTAPTRARETSGTRMHSQVQYSRPRIQRQRFSVCNAGVVGTQGSVGSMCGARCVCSPAGMAVPCIHLISHSFGLILIHITN